VNGKVHLVRFWLFCLTVLGAMLVVPDAAWLLPIAYFTGQAGCFCCDSCDGCQTGTASGDLQIELDNITNHGCSACIEYNATWIVAPDATAAFCTWIYEDTSIQVCGTNPPIGPGLRVIAFFSGSGPFLLNVLAQRNTGTFPQVYGSSEQFQESYDPAPDCSAFSSESIAHTAHAGTGFGGTSPDCAGTPTCLVTSL